MESLSLHVTPSQLDSAVDKLKQANPQFMIVMGNTDSLKDGKVVALLHKNMPNTRIIGCSTSGEIGNRGVTDGGFEIAAGKFGTSDVKTVSEDLTSSDLSKEVGKKLAAQLVAPGLKGVFVLAPGVNINGSELVAGMREHLPAEVTLTGGLAGDGTRFQETVTILGGDVYKSRVVAIGFYGENLLIGAGSKGGWKPFGPPRKVTKVEGNVLYELDGKPALELYKNYLGEHAANLPASGLLYPFAILREDRSTTGLIRTILNVDHEKNSLILAGDIPPDSLVCLMHADKDSLASGSGEAAQEAVSSVANQNDSLSICVSCVGRRLVMGEDIDDEIDSVSDTIGDNTNLIGFYSYGEIAPFSETGKPELHNQTMTITYISER